MQQVCDGAVSAGLESIEELSEDRAEKIENENSVETEIMNERKIGSYRRRQYRLRHFI